MEATLLYVRLQLLLTIFLVVLLWSLYVRLPRQEFFRWWAWAETSFVGFFAFGSLLMHLGPRWTLLQAGLLWLMLACAFLQVSLLILGAWSLRRARTPETRRVAVHLGLALAAATVVLAISSSWRGHPFTSLLLRAVPHTMALGGALLFCSYAFVRRWWQDRSWATGIIGLSCFLYATNQTAYAWTYTDQLLQELRRPSLSPTFGIALITNPALYFLDLAYLCGICLGMVLVLVEEHQYTERLLWESNNHSREIAASNTALQAEIEERRRVETALRESEDRYRDLVENSQDLLCTHDLEGWLLSVNPAPARILGYEVQELLRMSMRDLIVPEYRNLFDEYLVQIQKEGIASGYLCVLTRQGERRIWEYHNSLRTEGVPVPIVRGLAHDVTERKLAERALRRSEQQLRQVQKMEAVGRVAGGMAHDFNNLLLGITLNIEQALRQLGPKDHLLMDFLDQALNAALSAASVTRRLLTFSRRQVFELQAVNLNDVVIATKDLLDRLGGENINLDTRLEDDLGKVSSDPVQLQQVILNLMLNARDAMPEGGQITIKTENFELQQASPEEYFSSIPPPGSYVVLEVCDTGTGMSAEALAHLFEPFFTTKESAAASGLGLPICYGIVTQSKGHISVCSTPGRGTKIRIYLPRLEHDVAETLPAKTRVAARDARRPHPVQTVLVVDDTEVVRSAVARDLRGVGYAVLTACNATEALLVSDQHKGPIELLVADVVMPGMNGRELARHLLRKRPDLRILFMTGYDKDTIATEGPVDSCEILLYKPFSSLELFAALGKLLDKEAA